MSDGSHFIARLLESVPELQDLHDVHVADNGETLSHVFMGDVTRFAISKSGQFGDKRTLKRLLAFIEKEMRAGEEPVQNLIRVSFIENLIGETSALNEIRRIAGRELLAEIDTICGLES